MNETKLYSVALFMIFLVMAIPICSANTFAELNAYSMGKSGTKNYRSETDKTTFYAEVPGTSATPGQFTLTSSTGKVKQFTKPCITQSGKSICSYDFTEGRWIPGTYDYTVSYSVTPESKKVTTVVDNLAPIVSITTDSGRQIHVKYTIQDKAFASQTGNLCSGVKTINFVLAGTVLQTLNVNKTPDTDCSFTNEITMDAESTQGIAKSFCVEAIDNVGNRGQACQNVVVDKEGAKAASLSVYDNSGAVMSYYSPYILLPVRLTFVLNENNASSITANASAFSSTRSTQIRMSSLPVSCTPPAAKCKGSCICLVDNVYLDAPRTSPSLNVHVVDSGGTATDLTLESGLVLDDSAPVLTKLYANTCGGTTNVLGPRGNVITAEMQEVGSGFNQRKIILDLTSILGLNLNSTRPTTCSHVGTAWTCSWGPFNKASGVSLQPGTSLPIVLSQFSQDDAGNRMKISNPEFIYQDTKPVFTNYLITAHQNIEFAEQLTAYPRAGGTAQLVLQINDVLPVVTAVADFSEITVDTGKLQTTCTGTNPHVCTFTEVGPLVLKDGIPGNRTIRLNISDCAGNYIDAAVNIDISLLATETNDYWDYSITDHQPSKIDRSTLLVFPHRMFFTLSANPHLSSGVIPVPILQQIVGCTGTTSAGAAVTDYLTYLPATDQRLPELMNVPSSGISGPIAKFNFRSTAITDDILTYRCRLKTVSKIGGTVSLPEEDNITFDVGFENAAAGTIDQNLRQKVNRVKNSSLVQGELIGRIQGLIDIVNNLCGTWGTLLTITNSVSAISGAVGDIIRPVPPAGSATAEWFKHQSQVLSDISNSGVGSIMKKICDFASCNWVPGANAWSQGVRRAVTDLQSGQITGLGGIPGGRTATTLVNVTVDPKKSLILSTAMLCIPGIVYNLQKARQIECAYILCVNTQVPNGVPPFFCEATRATEWCKYVYGELFNFIPFTMFIDRVISLTRQALQDPITTAISLVLTCRTFLTPASLNALHAACLIAKNTVTLVGAVTSYVDAQSWRTMFRSNVDLCEEVLKNE